MARLYGGLFLCNNRIMKTGKLNCPRCNALQNFGEQKREISDNFFELFIRCGKCRWETVVFSGNARTISNYRKIQRLKGKAAANPRLVKVLREAQRK